MACGKRKIQAMPKRYRVPGKARLHHFIKDWRIYRGLTQEQLADRLSEHGDTISAATVSRIERGALPYTQDMLEAIADALGLDDPASLLMRNPLEPEAPWSIWDKLKPATKRQALELLKTLQRTDEAEGEEAA